MSPHPFYTRSPELAEVKRLVQAFVDVDHPFESFNKLIVAVDEFCSQRFPGGDRGGWFAPRILGGSPISHTPPHIIFWVYAIYLHLVNGDIDPVPFLSAPLRQNGATAITMEPSEQFLVSDGELNAYPMTDVLLIVPARTPRTWTADTYGLPEIQPNITIIGWHAAAQPFLKAVCSGQLLLEPESRTVLDPLAAFSEEEEPLFFTEPVNQSRLNRYRERLTEVFGTPLEVLGQGSGSVRRVLEAYLSLPSI